MSYPSVVTHDGRQAWAFVAVWIGCIVFTVFAAVAVWLLAGNALYTLILGLAAHLQLLIGMGAFSFVLGRRMRVKGGKDGFEYADNGTIQSGDTVTVEKAE